MAFMFYITGTGISPTTAADKMLDELWCASIGFADVI
jgi:hypothetical protein